MKSFTHTGFKSYLNHIDNIHMNSRMLKHGWLSYIMPEQDKHSEMLYFNSFISFMKKLKPRSILRYLFMATQPI